MADTQTLVNVAEPVPVKTGLSDITNKAVDAPSDNADNVVKKPQAAASTFDFDWNMSSLTTAGDGSSKEAQSQAQAGKAQNKHIRFVYSDSGEMVGAVEVENKHPLQIAAEADLPYYVDDAEPAQGPAEQPKEAENEGANEGAQEEEEVYEPEVERMALPDGALAEVNAPEPASASTAAAGKARKDGWLPKGSMDGAAPKPNTHIRFI